jgi:hypothetical protein
MLRCCLQTDIAAHPADTVITAERAAARAATDVQDGAGQRDAVVAAIDQNLPALAAVGAIAVSGRVSAGAALCAERAAAELMVPMVETPMIKPP